ncbi:MAG: Gfo/Idh/MocA family oxidoreductase [Kiritimatiellia bacterium]
MNRRNFLKGSALTAAALGFTGCDTFCGSFSYPAITTVAPKFRKPGEKLNIGVIGVGGKGWSDWTPMLKNGENIVALCDVDRNYVDKGVAEIKKTDSSADVKRYSDYRRMLDDIGDKLDAVTISTPDHTHAPAAIRSMKMGCSCFVQKPLVRTIWEARYFEKVAKASGVITQMGNQGSAGDGFRRNVELLQAGILGNVSEVHVWTNRPVWPQGIGRPEGSDPVPETLNWDCWLGTAPVRPYKKDAYHRFNWRGFFDFGTGAFGDMACHTMNLPYRGLNLKDVVAAECQMIEGKNNETYPNKSIVKMTYAKRWGMPEVDLFWYDGKEKPSADIMPQVIATLGAVPKTGCLIIGDKGVMCSTNDNGQEAYVALKGEKKMKSAKKHPALVDIPQSLERCGSNHYVEFVNAVKGIENNYCDIDHSVPMLEGMLVGCIAQQVPGRLIWNSRRQKFTGGNVAPANDLLIPYTRRGFEF